MQSDSFDKKYLLWKANIWYNNVSGDKLWCVFLSSEIIILIYRGLTLLFYKQWSGH